MNFAQMVALTGLPFFFFVCYTAYWFVRKIFIKFMKMTDDGIQDEEISPLNALEHVHFKLIQITLIF